MVRSINNAMKFNDAKKTIKALIPTKKPILLQGSPGIGKSAMMRSIASELQFESFIDIRGTTLRPPDLRGLMYLAETPEGREAKFAAMSLLPRSGKHLILFDELPTCSTEVQAALYQLLLDRQLGEYKVPEETIILAAGNRQEDRAGASRILTPLATRFITTINMESNLEDWIEWALSTEIRPEIIAFLQLNPTALNTFDPRSKDVSYACERSWENASLVLDYIQDKITLRDVLCGTIGQIAGNSFYAFLAIYDKICRIPEILANPNKYRIPDSPEESYSITAALGYTAKTENLKDILIYVERLQDEFKVLFSQHLHKRKPNLMETTAYTNFAAKNTHTIAC